MSSKSKVASSSKVEHLQPRPTPLWNPRILSWETERHYNKDKSINQTLGKKKEIFYQPRKKPIDADLSNCIDRTEKKKILELVNYVVATREDDENNPFDRYEEVARRVFETENIAISPCLFPDSIRYATWKSFSKTAWKVLKMSNTKWDARVPKIRGCTVSQEIRKRTSSLTNCFFEKPGFPLTLNDIKSVDSFDFPSPKKTQKFQLAGSH